MSNATNRRPLRERRWSNHAVSAATKLNRVAQRENEELAEVQVDDELVDLRRVYGFGRRAA